MSSFWIRRLGNIGIIATQNIKKERGKDMSYVTRVEFSIKNGETFTNTMIGRLFALSPDNDGLFPFENDIRKDFHSVFCDDKVERTSYSGHFSSYRHWSEPCENFPNHSQTPSFSWISKGRTDECGGNFTKMVNAVKLIRSLPGQNRNSKNHYFNIQRRPKRPPLFLFFFYPLP